MTRARKSLWRAWGLGIGGGELSARGAAGLWETLARPALEYGAEIDTGEWREAERLQLLAGRMSLGVGAAVANEVVRGDLGWWTMKGRREYLRLVYWGKLVREKEETMMSTVDREGRRRIEQGIAKKHEWCVKTAELLKEAGLAEWWGSEEVGSAQEWKSRVRFAMGLLENLRWREGIVQGGGRVDGAKVAKMRRKKNENFVQF